MSELFTLFGSDAPADEQVSALLHSADRKARMSAYAYLYAQPSARTYRRARRRGGCRGHAVRPVLGNAVTAPAGGADPAGLDAATRLRLEQLATTLEPASDAADELRQLLGETSTRP